MLRKPAEHRTLTDAPRHEAVKRSKFDSVKLFLSAQKAVHMQGDEEEVGHVTARERVTT